MSRISFAILFGILFPLGYLVALCAFVFLSTATIYPEGLPHLVEEFLSFPIDWIDKIYNLFFETREMFEFTNPRWIIFFFGGNFLMYFLIGNFVWSWREKRRGTLSIVINK